MAPMNKHRGVESLLTLYCVSGATKIWLLPACPHEFSINYNKTVIRTVFAQNNFGSREAVYKRSQRRALLNWPLM